MRRSALKVLARRQALDAVGVALVGALVVPEPMLAAIGQDDERGLEIFRIAACLLLRVVGIEVFALGFQHAEDAAQPVLEQIVAAAAGGVQLELDLLGVEQIPAAGFERLVDEDSGECFVLTGH